MSRAALFCFLGLATSALPMTSRQASLPVSWGEAETGLRLGLVAAVESEKPEFQVAIENTSDTDVVINLGFMLANGKVMCPQALHFTLSDPDGKTRTLDYFDRRHPAIAGRVDDYVVALRARSIHVLRLSLDQFISATPSELDLRLSPGTYRIEARFDGEGAKATNSDSPGIALLNFWKGTLRSNPVVFHVT